jgi:phage terminase small subunit
MDLSPPRPLSLPARQAFDRQAKRIYGEGRWNAVDLELLCVWSETLELYIQFRDDVATHGTLVQGRSQQEFVKNPSLVGLAQTRADLARYARQIPLMPKREDPHAADRARVKRLLDDDYDDGDDFDE